MADSNNGCQAGKPGAGTDGLTSKFGGLTINQSPQHGKQWKKFVEEPLGKKLVITVPGIGSTYEEELKKKGITKACELVGHFICVEGDERKYIDWLEKNCQGIIRAKSKNVYDGIKEWCEQHHIWT